MRNIEVVVAPVGRQRGRCAAVRVDAGEVRAVEELHAGQGGEGHAAVVEPEYAAYVWIALAVRHGSEQQVLRGRSRRCDCREEQCEQKQNSPVHRLPDIETAAFKAGYRVDEQ